MALFYHQHQHDRTAIERDRWPPARLIAHHPRLPLFPVAATSNDGQQSPFDVYTVPICLGLPGIAPVLTCVCEWLVKGTLGPCAVLAGYVCI